MSYLSRKCQRAKLAVCHPVTFWRTLKNGGKVSVATSLIVVGVSLAFFGVVSVTGSGSGQTAVGNTQNGSTNISLQVSAVSCNLSAGGTNWSSAGVADLMSCDAGDPGNPQVPANDACTLNPQTSVSTSASTDHTCSLAVAVTNPGSSQDSVPASSITSLVWKSFTDSNDGTNGTPNCNVANFNLAFAQGNGTFPANYSTVQAELAPFNTFSNVNATVVLPETGRSETAAMLLQPGGGPNGASGYINNNGDGGAGTAIQSLAPGQSAWLNLEGSPPLVFMMDNGQPQDACENSTLTEHFAING